MPVLTNTSRQLVSVCLSHWPIKFSSLSLNCFINVILFGFFLSFSFFFSRPFNGEIPVWENLCYAAAPASSPQEPSAGFYFQSRSKFHRFSSPPFFTFSFHVNKNVGQEKLFITRFTFPSNNLTAFQLQMCSFWKDFLREVVSAVCLQQTQPAENKQLKPTDQKPLESFLSETQHEQLLWSIPVPEFGLTQIYLCLLLLLLLHLFPSSIFSSHLLLLPLFCSSS